MSDQPNAWAVDQASQAGRVDQADQADRVGRSGQAGWAGQQHIAFPPSRFTLIYESKDGRLCLFEDAEGHITAVRAEKLA